MTSQHRRNVRLQALLGLTLCAAGCATQAQTTSDDEPSASTQLWGNLILGFSSGEPWYFETDIEPKVLVSGGEPWRNLDVTQSFEYYPNRYFDLIGEVVGGYTQQSDDVDTAELTERVGVRVNLLYHLREYFERSTRGLGRVGLAVLIRLEHRTFWYSGDAGSDDDWRARLRFESKAGLNHPDMSQDGTLYGLFDVEYYWPLSDGLDERYISKVRARAGLGYRISRAYRVELLYMREWTRDSAEGQKRPDANIFDVRFKRYF
jgi:Protein of unknown function (DUF2490)